MATSLIGTSLANKMTPEELAAYQAQFNPASPDVSAMAPQVPQNEPQMPAQDISAQTPNDFVASNQNITAQDIPQAPSQPMPTSAPNTMDEYAAKLKEDQLRRNAEMESLKNTLSQYANAPQRTDLRPLASWVSGMTGNKALYEAANALAPESADVRAKNIMAEQAQLAKMSGDSQLAEKLIKLQQGQQRADSYTNRSQIAEKNLSYRMDKEARSTIDKDPLLKQYIPRLEGAAKIGELIDAAKSGKVVSNQSLLGQLNAEISRLETGSQSPGLHSSEKTELLDRAAQISAFKDSITGSPTDSVRPEVINAAGKLVDELKGSYMRGIDSRMNMLKAGTIPSQKNIIEEKHKSLKETYKPRFGGEWNSTADAPADNLDNISDDELYKLYHGGK